MGEQRGLLLLQTFHLLSGSWATLLLKTPRYQECPCSQLIGQADPARFSQHLPGHLTGTAGANAWSHHLAGGDRKPWSAASPGGFIQCRWLMVELDFGASCDSVFGFLELFGKSVLSLPGPLIGFCWRGTRLGEVKVRN